MDKGAEGEEVMKWATAEKEVETKITIVQECGRSGKAREELE